MSQRAFAVAVASSLYRLSIKLCPPGLISDPGEVVAVFRAALAADLESRGWRGYAGFCIGALADALRVAAVERLLRGRQWLARIWPGSAAPASACRPRRERLLAASLAIEVRLAIRSLRKTPLVAVAATLTIALAVGLTTVTLSAVYGTILRPLPFAGGERIVSVRLAGRDGAGRVQFEALDLRDFRLRQTSFEALAGYFRRRVTLLDDDGLAQSLRAGVVTANALEHLGTSPLLGRTFRAGEDFTRSIRHVVLGHAVWRQRFGGRYDILGCEVRIDGRMLEVIGVMPAGFRFPVDEDLWLPMDFDLPQQDRGSGRSFAVFGRLAAGVGLDRAQAEARDIAGRIGIENPAVHPPLTARIEPFTASHLPAGLDSTSRILVVAVAGILLIAGANLVNLLLARAVVRSRETTIRAALGAGGVAIQLPFLVEACVLSAAGAVLGLGLAAAGMAWLDRAMSRFSLPYWIDVRLDLPVLAACCALAALFALAAGLTAARHSRRWRGESLAPGCRSAMQPRLGLLGRALVTAQVAVSCALLIGAGLLGRSLVNARTLDRGYDAERVMSADLRLPRVDYPSASVRSELFLTLLERAAGLPGVAGAALARSPPGTGPTFAWEFQVEGADRGPARAATSADGVPISHGYFNVMGIRRVRGRDFTPAESRYGSPPAVIVNETLAQRHLGPEPVGHRLRLGGSADEPWLTVVGVVEDAYIGSSSGGIGLTSAKREQIYVAWGIAPYSNATILLRSQTEGPLALAPQARALLAQIAPAVALDQAANLGRTIEDSTWAFGLFGGLFGIFGGVALSLSIVGLYGVTAFAVDRRRQEMGLRMALGAAPSAIHRLVFATTAWQLTAGTAIGSLLGYWLARSMQAMLFGVGSIDWGVYGAVALGLAITGAWATLLSARRATRLDPAQILDG